MTLKHLTIFVAVYKEENISAAARKLNLKQPAVSLAIKELETQYSIKLFERLGRGIQKTAASHHFYEYAVHITSLYTELDHELRTWSQKANLRIGSSISIGACLMPNYIKTYLKTYETAMPFVKIDSSDIIEQMVLDNQLDLALIEGSIHSDMIMAEPLIKDRLILVCNRFHPLVKKDIIALDDIKEEPFLLREKNSGTRELAESTLLLHNFTVKPIWESTSTTSIINAVLAGLGLSILPERMLTAYLQHKQLIKLNLKGIEFYREYHIIYHQNKYLTPAITRFIDFIKQETPNQLP